jgi:hypothetical protein
MSLLLCTLPRARQPVALPYSGSGRAWTDRSGQAASHSANYLDRLDMFTATKVATRSATKATADTIHAINRRIEIPPPVRSITAGGQTFTHSR